MKKLLAIEAVTVHDSGKTIHYKYRYDRTLAKFFRSRPTFYVTYEHVDLTNVPQHILVIPLLAQLLPIAWFAGFTIETKSVDSTFYAATREIRKQMFASPTIDNFNDDLLAHSVVEDNKPSGNRSLLLYSGGVDSVSSYIQHRSGDLDVASIFGADITLDNRHQLKMMRELVAGSSLLSRAEKYFIESNMRDFYSYHVPMLLPDRAWWGKVQHGLGLTGLLAPITYLHGHKRILISSTYSSDSKFDWGSTPVTDNLIGWGNTRVVHDAYELKRTAKINLIVDKVRSSGKPVLLRVCYSSKNVGLNCSTCEKCYRTMLGLVVNNAHPNDYGFRVSDSLYDDIKVFVSRGFYSEGELYFWKEIADSINNKRSETVALNEIADLILLQYRGGARRPPFKTLFRQKVQLMFPRLTRGLIRLRNRVFSN